jgi:Tol biopolymer transport system component
MKKQYWLLTLLSLLLASGLIFAFFIVRNNKIKEKELFIVYPFNETLFPPEFTAPVFRWMDKNNSDGPWEISLFVKGSGKNLIARCETPFWCPRLAQWDSLKAEAGQNKIFFKVTQIPSGYPASKRRSAKISFSFSSDSVGAPIMYREIPLPFAWAEEHLDSMSYRLVNPGSNNPPATIMTKFMVCGNCHSTSADGKTIGLDFDAAHRDKGGYFITDIKDTMIFDTSNYLSWNKLQDQKSFGMFSKLSPNGRYVVTTIRDRVISHNFRYDPERVAFSQIFFPVNGVLAIYDRETGKIKELPGANLDEFVQSNAFWTPDGKNILFVRAKALPYKDSDKDFIVKDEKVIDDFVNRRTDFKFDIYKIPFNEGNGGKAEPVKGASDNGMSNYFPAVSPDGKWLVFCKAENYMLLMPDSRLYIVPVDGGKARKLRCNLYLMNSWHAWSPNSKWIVFISKGLSIHSDMFLTHIDNRGNASSPVLIENARKHGRAANYPEFINAKPDYTFNMIYKYIEIAHIKRAILAGDTALATIYYNQYLAQGQYSLIDEYIFLGSYNLEKKHYSEAAKFLKVATDKDPNNEEARILYKRVLAKLK